LIRHYVSQLSQEVGSVRQLDQVTAGEEMYVSGVEERVFL
jgi:hypothetical protein